MKQTSRRVSVTTLPYHPAPRESDAAMDELLATHSTVRLLITATTPAAVETIARRVHTTGSRTAFPFVSMKATDFPLEPRLLKGACSTLLDAASGGTLFVSNVEMMPATVQRQFVGVLQDLQSERVPAASVRLVSGTSVSLSDCVATGTFSEALLYRLNVLHLEPERLPSA
jgi:two-component system, NtrC family, C4-dicarboxylate transport response regulator DctD